MADSNPIASPARKAPGTSRRLVGFCASNGRPAAGLIQIEPEWGDVPSNLSVVLEVADCDAAVAKVQELGGRVGSSSCGQ